MRQKGNRPLEQRICIVGEGQTEQFYFHHLKQLKQWNYTITPSLFQNNSLDKIEAKIEECLRARLIVVAVFDTDITDRNTTERRKLQRIRQRYSANEKVILCDSFPSIEFWFLLHFVATTRYYPSSNDVIKDLQRHLPAFSKSKTYLERDAWVRELLADDKLARAVKAAEKCIDSASYSNIPNALKLFESKN